MAKGRLSTVEKYVIQGMLNDNKSIKDIAKTLERTEKAVKNYADGELKSITSTIEKIDDKKTQALEQMLADAQTKINNLQTEKSQGETHDEMVSRASEKLNLIPGLDGEAGRLISKALEEHGEPPNSEVLFAWALQGLTARHVMGRKLDMDKKGVATVMTKAASEKGDAMRETMPNTISRTARNNLFAPLDNKMIRG
jgi:predicted transcriptional regulator